jgi:5-methylcytosine-specific restriction endonuclease McrA
VSTILVLNATYEPISTTRLSRAMTMLLNGVAVVEEAEPGKFIRHAAGSIPLPRVLRLVKYVKVAVAHRPAGWSKRGVLARDGHACGYCGKRATTVDHIVPRSRGGAHVVSIHGVRAVWLNTVACCGVVGRTNGCNGKKADRTPDEAGMTLYVRPYQPTRAELAELMRS